VVVFPDATAATICHRRKLFRFVVAVSNSGCICIELGMLRSTLLLMIEYIAPRESSCEYFLERRLSSYFFQMNSTSLGVSAS
jgi:hypothetical protein